MYFWKDSILHFVPRQIALTFCSTDKFLKGNFYKGQYFTTQILFKQKLEKKHKTCIFPLLVNLVTLLDGFIGQNYVRKLALVSFCNPFIVAPIRAFF